MAQAGRTPRDSGVPSQQARCRWGVSRAVSSGAGEWSEPIVRFRGLPLPHRRPATVSFPLPGSD